MSRGNRQYRVDGNHKEVLDGLREWGAAAFSTAAVGGGFPDIVASYAGRTVLFEVKDPAKPPSARKLTADEISFRNTWKGSVYTVLTSFEACQHMRNEVCK